MAITNKEIIEGQLRRINEKAHLQLVLKRANRHWYLCREVNGYELPPSPLNESFTRRTSAEMIEYLRGVEDAVDFFHPQRHKVGVTTNSCFPIKIFSYEERRKTKEVTGKEK